MHLNYEFSSATRNEDDDDIGLRITKLDSEIAGDCFFRTSSLSMSSLCREDTHTHAERKTPIKFVTKWSVKVQAVELQRPHTLPDNNSPFLFPFASLMM